MRLPLIILPFLTPTMAMTEAFQRPIPQPQTAQAELAYFVASLVFLGALVAVQWLINRK